MNKRWQKRLSIRNWPIAWKFVLAILAVLLIVLGLTSWIGDLLVSESLIKGEERELVERATQQGEQIARFRDDNLRNLYLSAARNNQVLLHGDEGSRQDVLQYEQLRLGDFVDLSLIDIKGTVLDSTEPSLLRKTWRGAAWMDGVQRQAAGISYMQLTGVLTESTFIFYVPVPKDDGDDPTLALIGRLPLYGIWDLVESVEIRTRGYSYLVDDNTVTIAHGYRDPETGQPTRHIVRMTVGFVTNPEVMEANRTQLYGGFQIVQEAGVKDLADFVTRGVPTPSLEDPSPNIIRYYFAKQGVEKTSVVIPIREPELGDLLPEIEANHWILGITVNDQDFLEPLVRLREGLTIVAVSTFLLSVVLAVILGRAFTRPIRLLADVVGRVEQGGYDERVHIKQEDEVGQLSRGVNAMLDRLAEAMAAQQRQLDLLLDTAGGVRQDAGMVSTSAEELAAATEELNASAGEVTATVQEMARDAYEQMNQVQRTAESIQGLDQEIQHVSDLSQRMGGASDRMCQLAEEAIQAVASAQEHSRRIESVVRIIEKFSRQTNLLALNATIEAARAGEMGESFAVVADEVRRMAENSRQALSDVSALNEAIRESMDTIKGAMGQTNDAIVGVVNLAEELSQTAARQSASSRSLVQGVNQLAGIAEKNAAGSEQMAAAAEEQTAAFEEISISSQEMAALSLRLQSLSRQLVAGRTETGEGPRNEA